MAAGVIFLGMPFVASMLALSLASAINTGPVTVTASDERVCVTERQPAYLNVDFLVHNPTARETSISEVRASVFDAAGKLIERRLVWQGATDWLGLGPGAKVPANADALIYNPLFFTSAIFGTRLTYEFDITGQDQSAVVRVVPTFCRTRAELMLPIKGRVAVLDGHDALSHHRRFNFLASWAKDEGMTNNVQRFALDLVVVDQGGKRFRDGGTRNEDFFGWGQPVRAPAAGLVVASHDGQVDNDVIGEENRWHGKTWESSSGNYVIIRHNAHEFSVIDHMRQGSLRVHKGEIVQTGEVIGEVGNSGSSLMPHVHYELQDGAGLQAVHGRPAYFRHFRFISGERVPPHGAVLDSGDIVIAD
jgi:hypothetical protein